MPILSQTDIDRDKDKSKPDALYNSWLNEEQAQLVMPPNPSRTAPADQGASPSGTTPVIQRPQPAQPGSIGELDLNSGVNSSMAPSFTPPSTSVMPTIQGTSTESKGRSPLRILGEIGRGVGSAVGQVAAPWAMPFIPGTVQHQMFEQGQQRRGEDFSNKQAEEKARTGQITALTGETTERTKEMPGEQQRAQDELDIRNKAEQRAEQSTTTQETDDKGNVFDVSRDPMTGAVTRKPATVPAQNQPDLGTVQTGPKLFSPPSPNEGYGAEQLRAPTKAAGAGTEKEYVNPATGKPFYGIPEAGGGVRDTANGQIVQGATVPEKSAPEGNQLQMWMKEHPGSTVDDYMKVEANAKPEFPRIQPVNDAKGNLVGYNEFTGTAAGVRTSFIPVSAIPGMPQNLGETPGVIPPKPTSAVLTQSQRSEMIQPQVEALKSQVEKTASSLGPLSGRWSEVMTGKVGADNPEVARLQMQLKLFGTALMLAHGLRGESYEKGLEQYLSLAQSPDNLRARIEGADAYLKDYAGSTGHGGKAGSAAGGAPDGASNEVYVGGKLVGHTVGNKYVPLAR